MGDKDINVHIREQADGWSWEVRYVNESVCSGKAVSLPRALRIARDAARREGWEFGRLTLVREHEEPDGYAHMVYGANITF